MIRKQSDIAKCADLIDLGTYVLEAWVPYMKELSVIVAKEADGGALNLFPVIENVYRDHRLFESIVKCELDSAVEEEIRRLATEIAKQLNYVGVLEVAFFLTKSGTIYVKRIVPALHKAGFVFDKATNVSMCEQHLRALAQMPLPQVHYLQPTVMVALQSSELEPMHTQWVLKDNWYYRFYRYPQMARTRAPGYLLVLAESTAAALQQIEATGIWSEPEQAAEKDIQ